MSGNVKNKFNFQGVQIFERDDDVRGLTISAGIAQGKI